LISDIGGGTTGTTVVLLRQTRVRIQKRNNPREKAKKEKYELRAEELQTFQEEVHYALVKKGEGAVTEGRRLHRGKGLLFHEKKLECRQVNPIPEGD